jgi:hypothetical protein
MSAAFRAYEGATYTREGLHSALDAEQRDGSIRGWRLRPVDPDVPTEAPPGCRYWQWLVILADGTPLPVGTVWELIAFLAGLASARQWRINGGL